MAIKIYIDQGHNPVNPNAGAEGNGLREQNVVFEIGRLLAERLNANPNFEARVSRPTIDTQLGTSTSTSLSTRVNEANRWDADYFLSLHTNASELPEATGSEALVYNRNSAAAELGEDLLFRLNQSTGLPNRGVLARPGLYVLRRTQMPAVLVELGFISNPGDAALMSQDPGLFAEGLYQGLRDYTGV